MCSTIFLLLQNAWSGGYVAGTSIGKLANGEFLGRDISNLTWAFFLRENLFNIYVEIRLALYNFVDNFIIQKN